ncbi:hypothetical protein RSOLAG22IIIB_09416 [Rhizoctonia solani]|uniref:Uncharacterized protein n=1 Tax=Rhizoctonia solani TaxID=456999 RepID=A0A0K6FYB5_9AGAM|nr:hypothetical protein RSOLAG22IIIB_09416 [Rhizoctonia solani]
MSTEEKPKSIPANLYHTDNGRSIEVAPEAGHEDFHEKFEAPRPDPAYRDGPPPVTLPLPPNPDPNPQRSTPLPGELHYTEPPPAGLAKACIVPDDHYVLEFTSDDKNSKPVTVSEPQPARVESGCTKGEWVDTETRH